MKSYLLKKLSNNLCLTLFCASISAAVGLMAFSTKISAQGMKPPEKGRWHFGLMALYASQSERRGALTWPGPSGLIVPTIGYSDWLTIGRGGSIELYQFIGPMRLGVGTSVFSDEPLIKLNGRKPNFRNQRDRSFEATINISVKTPLKGRVSAAFFKDVGRHNGNFIEAGIKFAPIPQFGLLKIGIEAGMGDKKHNRYLYGQGSVGGMAYHRETASLLLPFLPYKGIMMIHYRKAHIFKDTNRHASYVRPSDNAQTLTMMMLWKL